MNYEELNSDVQVHLTDDFTEDRYWQMVKGIKISPTKILDIGIGSGRGGFILREAFPEAQIYGIDAVRSRTEISNSPYIEIRYESATQTSYPDFYFDLILAGEVIEHIAVSDVNKFLFEVNRLLKIGGRFCLTTPNPQDIKLRIRGRTILGGSHLSQHFIRETKVRLRLASFRILRCRGTGKTSRYIGTHLPKFLYGSYLILATKV